MILCNVDAPVLEGGAPPPAAPATPPPASPPAAPLLSGNVSAAPDWKADLPADVKTEGSLASIKSVADLAKSYVHAQKLVGVDKMPAPNEKWTPEQWNEHFDRIGRPKTPDAYNVPEIKLADGKVIGKEQLKDALGVFHEAGLTAKQAEKVLSYYGKTTADAEAAKLAATNVSRDTALTELEREWGANTAAKIDLAKAALQKFGDENILKALDASGLSNNPAVIRMLSKIGESVSEDSSTGTGQGLQLQSSTTAVQEIQRLRADREFMAAWGDREHPGHKDAVAKWTKLHQAGYGS